MVQVGSELGKLRPGALFLPFLFILRNLSVVLLEIAAHFLVFSLYILQVLLAGVKVMLPTAAVVSTIADQR